ncbi:uncharacterized protein LJ206_010534 isoform 1-T1 [Theristicus caerulescens]
MATLDRAGTGRSWSVSASVPAHTWVDHVHHTSLPWAQKSQGPNQEESHCTNTTSLHTSCMRGESGNLQGDVEGWNGNHLLNVNVEMAQGYRQMHQYSPALLHIGLILSGQNPLVLGAKDSQNMSALWLRAQHVPDDTPVPQAQ